MSNLRVACLCAFAVCASPLTVAGSIAQQQLTVVQPKEHLISPTSAVGKNKTQQKVGNPKSSDGFTTTILGRQVPTRSDRVVPVKQEAHGDGLVNAYGGPIETKSDPTYQITEDDIKKLEKAFSDHMSDPDVKAKLLSGYNQYGTSLAENPTKAMRCFLMALWLDKANVEGGRNLRGILEKSGRDPKSACEYEAIAEEFLSKSDNKPAAAAYMEAIKLNDAQPLWSKYKAAFAKASQTTVAGDVDFGPYMGDLQRRIRKKWLPSHINDNRHAAVVSFTIHRWGEVSNISLHKSSGVASYDAAALKAIQDAAPLRPLPDAAPEKIDMQFSFGYNAVEGSSSGTYKRF